MKFFQKTGVAVTITALAVIAALVIGLWPVIRNAGTKTPASAPAQSVSASAETSSPQTAAAPSSAGSESVGNKYIKDDAGLFTRSGETAIADYNDRIYTKTGSHVAILTVNGTNGVSIENYTNSQFDAMALSEYDMLFAIDVSDETWYVTTGSYVADYTNSKLETIFQDGFAAILDGDADDAAQTLYKDLYSWCKSNLSGVQQDAYYAEEPVQRSGRKSLIGTIITLLVIFWIIKAIFGSGRRGGGGGGGGFWSGLFLGSLFSNRHHHHGPGPGPRPGGFGGPRPGGFGGGPRPGGGSRGGFGGGRGGFGGR